MQIDRLFYMLRRYVVCTMYISQVVNMSSRVQSAKEAHTTYINIIASSVHAYMYCTGDRCEIRMRLTIAY